MQIRPFSTNYNLVYFFWNTWDPSGHITTEIIFVAILSRLSNTLTGLYISVRYSGAVPCMHAPVSDNIDFEVHHLFNRKPVEVISERRRYVVELC